jgi:uncharacterized protein YkwD
VGLRGAIVIAIAATVALGAAYPFALPRGDRASAEAARGCAGAAPGSARIERTRATILCLLNEERARHGLRPLERNAILEAASQRHSEDMARRHFFAHRTPDGMTPGERISAAGYPVCDCYVGENLYWGAGRNAPPAKAMEGWMDSPGHRKNVLSPEFTEVGVGVVYDSPFWVGKRQAAIYTTDFGGPLEPEARRARSARDARVDLVQQRLGVVQREVLG